MDIFQNKDGFFGKPNFASIQNHTREFWNLANKLKAELGDKGYYMDIYLNVMFEALANIDLNTASFVADTICSNIISDCRVCLKVTPDHRKSEFFELVKKHIKEHPVDFKGNHTKAEFYAGDIILENLELLHDEFKKQYKVKALKDINGTTAKKYLQKISEIIGKEKVDKFNDILYEAFLVNPIGLSVTQHFLVFIVGTLLYDGTEEAPKLYQLMMEEE